MLGDTSSTDILVMAAKKKNVYASEAGDHQYNKGLGYLSNTVYSESSLLFLRVKLFFSSKNQNVHDDKCLMNSFYICSQREYP